MNILNLIGALITVGGMGYINYAVTSQLKTYEPHGDDKTSQIATALGWSIVDYALYLLLGSLLSAKVSNPYLTVITMLLTMAISFMFTVTIAKPLQKLVYWCYNQVFKVSHENRIEIGNLWDNVFKGDDRTYAYCYDFNHTPVGFGVVCRSTIGKGHALQLSPFLDDKQEAQPSYIDMVRISQKPDNNKQWLIGQMVDFDNRLIIFTMKPISSKEV